MGSRSVDFGAIGVNVRETLDIKLELRRKIRPSTEFTVLPIQTLNGAGRRITDLKERKYMEKKINRQI